MRLARFRRIAVDVAAWLVFASLVLRSPNWASTVALMLGLIVCTVEVVAELVELLR